MKFLDGPAEGQSLMLQRAPLFLRLVLKPDLGGGTWDGLDLPEDTPEPAEIVCCYVRASKPVAGFWDGTDKRGRRTGGMFASADYKFHDHQPPGDVMRDNALWRDWCLTEIDRLKGGAQ